MTVDWTMLRDRATDAASCAYAPYSGLHVGAAGITEDGVIVTGCNVENVSYGLSLCAECSLVSDLRRQGGGRLVAVATVDGDGNALAPCGRCRQVLLEHGGPELLLDAGSGPVELGALLPGAFDQATLRERTETSDRRE